MFHTYHKALVVAGLVFCSLSSAFAYSGGSGTAEEPYQIADANDLLTLAGTTADYNKCFILTADIDLDPNLPGGQVFTTAIIAEDTVAGISFEGTAFTGTFDGNGYKITNFAIDGGSNDHLGLFGKIDTGGTVKNLGLENCAVSGVSDSYYVGGLVGYNYGGGISNCYSTGTVSGDNYVGGLVGLNYSYGSISNCYSTGAVSASGSSGSQDVGGLVGYNVGTISNCYSTGTVTGGDYSYYLGGLVGFNYSYGIISNCYSTGAVSGGSDSSYVGGLVGWNSSSISISISNCYSTGTVSGTWYVGGLVGLSSGSISNCYSTGAVSGGSSSYHVGGLVGYNSGGSISNCYSTGAVSGYSSVGGLVGLNYYGSSSISDCYSTGTVSGSSYVGGLVGYKSGGSISSCYFLDTSGPDNGYGTPLPDEEMKQQSSFVGWDFTTIWAICEGTNYPRLLWQIPAADFTCPDGVDFIDFAILANAWLSDPTQVNWNGRCDIAEPPDSIIDVLDLAIFAQHWLEQN